MPYFYLSYRSSEAATAAELIMTRNSCNWRRLNWFNPGYQTWFVLSKKKSSLPSIRDSFFLLGGEEVGSKQYKKQHFISNRIYSFKRKYKTIIRIVLRDFRLLFSFK